MKILKLLQHMDAKNKKLENENLNYISELTIKEKKIEQNNKMIS